MEVIATDEKGGTRTLTTSTQGGTNNPIWNNNLVFKNTVSWKKITVHILDDDGIGSDPDPLCPTQEIDLKTGKQTESFDCNPGETTIEYTLKSQVAYLTDQNGLTIIVERLSYSDNPNKLIL